MSDKVKNWLRNVFATTAISILCITIVGILTGDATIYIAVVWQTAVANVVIHLGILAVRRLQSIYFLVEILLELGLVIGVILLTGVLCGWFATTPIWMTLVVTLAVFGVACLINIVSIRRDIEEINREIELRERTEQI